MRNTLLLGSAILATSFVVAPNIGNTQVSKQGEKYLLRISWAKGKTYRWKISTATTMPGQAPMNMNTGYAAQVKDVKNGIATIVFTSDKMPGQTTAPKPAEVKMDNRGKVVSGSVPGMDSLSVAMPAGPVAVGQKWSETRNLSGGMTGGAGSMKVTTNYTFKGVKSVGGRQVAVIDTSTSIGGNPQMSGTGTGTMTLDLADGMLRNFSMSQTMKIKNGQNTMTLPVKVTVARA